MNNYERSEYLNSLPDEVLAVRSQSLDQKIIDLQGVSEPHSIHERTIPALALLKTETDTIYLDHEITVPVSPESFSLRCEDLLKGRKEINRVARALLTHSTIGDITKKAFGQDTQANRLKTEIWLNSLRILELEPRGINLDSTTENENPVYHLTETKKRAELLPVAKLQEKKPKDSEVTLSRLTALEYVALSDELHLDKLLDILGETKANRQLKPLVL